MPEKPEFNTTGNEIKKLGVFLGGALLVFFTVAAVVFLVAFWPDKIPDANHTGDNKYILQLFFIRLLPDGDSTHAGSTIDLNTIYLILVALAGFLGNMIHVATSFTTFVGNENFKKSWIIWYIVKPFTAAALAIIIYFIIRAGFLSYGSDAKNVSLYGILSLSALAGLFTDTATLKLKEVFETMFKPKDERDDKLMTIFKIDAVVPLILQKGVNKVSLKGKGVNSKKLSIKIENQEVTITTATADAIDLTYTVADTALPQAKLTLIVYDETGTSIFKQLLTVQ